MPVFTFNLEKIFTKRGILTLKGISSSYLPRKFLLHNGYILSGPILSVPLTQRVERNLNKTAKAINETFAGLKLMLQGF